MTDPATAVALAPLADAFSLLVQASVSAAVVGVGGVVFAALAKWTGVAFTPDYQAKFEGAVAKRVNVEIAKDAANLATRSFDAGNPMVASIANALIASEAPLIAKAGVAVTPEAVQQEVLHVIGQIQRGVTRVNPAAPKAPPAPAP